MATRKKTEAVDEVDGQLATMRPFRTFLRADTARMFLTKHACDCPLATWIKEKLGRNALLMERYWVERGDPAVRQHPNPAWVQHFVRAVDGLDALEVSAVRCLDLLTAIEVTLKKEAA